jgi:hypothetical protein
LTVSKPSEKAINAAADALAETFARAGAISPAIEDADVVLEAAHDPALGLDRSVCLRDVVEKLRDAPQPYQGGPASAASAADFIEREFSQRSDRAT